MTEDQKPQAKRVRLEGPPVVDSNECITFHLLKRIDGNVVLEEDGHFPPEMTHQLFDEEEIKGYDGLEIDVFFTPSFQALVDVKYINRVEKGATNLAEPFKKTFPAGFYETKQDFDRAFEQEAPLNLSQLGEVVIKADTQQDTTIQVLRSNLATAAETVRSLHAHLEPLLIFFVDAASAIDANDPAWDLLLAVEVANDGSSVDVLGFATVYSFYVYPDRTRLRLSQVLVLPPYQGRGVGSRLVDAVYAMAEKKNAVDITLEDPTDDLRRIRDRKDVRNMLDADWPRQEAETALASLTAQKGKAEAEPNGAPAPSPLAPSPETLSKLQSQLRLSKQQAKRSWENLLYAVAVEQGAKAADEDGDMEASAQAVAAVEGLVAGSIEAQVANAKKGSEGKAVTETDSGFVMAKTKRGVKPSGAGYVPVEGASAEQQREAIQKAVAVRVEEMRRLVGLRNEGEDDEEGQA